MYFPKMEYKFQTWNVFSKNGTFVPKMECMFQKGCRAHAGEGPRRSWHRRIAPGTRAELEKRMMTERYHMRGSSATTSLFMTGYATDLSQQCDFFFFMCGHVPSGLESELAKVRLTPFGHQTSFSSDSKNGTLFHQFPKRVPFLESDSPGTEPRADAGEGPRRSCDAARIGGRAGLQSHSAQPLI
jgi:hypothetical protein